MRIDIHSHLIPRCFWTAVADKGSWFGATLETADGRRYIDTRDRRAGPVEDNWNNTLQERIEDMDSQGVDMQVLSPAPYFSNYHLDIEDALAASRELNDEIAAAVRDHPDRFSGLATVPLQDVSSAIKELDRSMNAGLKGAQLCTHVNGRNYDDPALFEFFEAAQRSGAFLFFHPHAPAAPERMMPYYLGNLIGNPLDTTIAIASLIFGGVLDRLPDLKLCFSHGGGYACYGIGRMDRGFAVRKESRGVISSPPSSYLRRLYFDSLTHSYTALDYLLETVTRDNVLMGSDYPYDMGYDSPAEWVLGAPNVSDSDKQKILGDNAAKLLGIG